MTTLALKTSVPGPTFGPKGFIEPDELTILSGVVADIQTAFGGTLNFRTNAGAPVNATPQGQLASSLAAIIGNTNDLFLKYTQQVDPMYADGRMQDGIARIYFIERNGSLPTTVQCTCTGLQGVSIPYGATTQDDSGNLYICTGSGTIPASGSIVLTFANKIPGPISCPAGSLTTIFQSIPGWDSIFNNGDGILGTSEETRAQFERRRALSVAQNAHSTVVSVLGAVLNIPKVIDAYVVENVEETVKSVGGVVLAPHSIYVAVVGGDADAIAHAIWSKKAPGCGYNGNVTITVYDDSPTYRPPFPKYQIWFERPESLPVVMKVTMNDNGFVPAEATKLIRDAIIKAFAGDDGGTRATIGAQIFASRYYCPVTDLGDWAQVVNIKLGCRNLSDAQFTGSLASGSGTGTGILTVNSVLSGSLAENQTLQGSGVTAGTLISTQLSGTAGSTGTYLVNGLVSNMPPQTMYGVFADNDDTFVLINQAPSISENDISIVLVQEPG